MVGPVTVMRTSYTPAWSAYGVDVVFQEYSSRGAANLPASTESGSVCSSRSLIRSRNSRRDVASASASMARRDFSALRIPAPTDSSADTAVMPTTAIATTASSRETPERRGRSERVGMCHSTPGVDANGQLLRTAMHDDGVGEGRTGRTKDVLQPWQI